MKVAFFSVLVTVTSGLYILLFSFNISNTSAALIVVTAEPCDLCRFSDSDIWVARSIDAAASNRETDVSRTLGSRASTPTSTP